VNVKANAIESLTSKTRIDHLIGLDSAGATGRDRRRTPAPSRTLVPGSDLANGPGGGTGRSRGGRNDEIVRESSLPDLLERPFVACRSGHSGRPRNAFSQAGRNLSARSVITSGKLGAGGPGPSYRARREEHALSIVAMGSGRLFLDRVASQYRPSPLHRHGQQEINYHRTVGVS